MTSQDDRVNAIEKCRKLLLDLVDPKITPRIPKAIRNRASDIMKEYPYGFDFVLIEKGLKENG